MFVSLTGGDKRHLNMYSEFSLGTENNNFGPFLFSKKKKVAKKHEKERRIHVKGNSAKTKDSTFWRCRKLEITTPFIFSARVLRVKIVPIHFWQPLENLGDNRGRSDGQAQ